MTRTINPEHAHPGQIFLSTKTPYKGVVVLLEPWDGLVLVRPFDRRTDEPAVTMPEQELLSRSYHYTDILLPWIPTRIRTLSRDLKKPT